MLAENVVFLLRCGTKCYCLTIMFSFLFFTFAYAFCRLHSLLQTIWVGTGLEICMRRLLEVCEVNKLWWFERQDDPLVDQSVIDAVFQVIIHLALWSNSLWKFNLTNMSVSWWGNAAVSKRTVQICIKNLQDPSVNSSQLWNVSSTCVILLDKDDAANFSCQ